MHSIRIAVPCAVMAALAVLPAGAQISLEGPLTVAAGSNPSEALVIDVNGDEAPDLLTLVDGPNRVLALMNNGSGTLLAGPASLVGGNLSPANIAAGDFNGDGIVDVAVSLKATSSVMIMPGVGNGTFLPGQSFAAGSNPRRLAVGDANGDGHLDIAVANRDDDTATVLMNNGFGSFTSVHVPSGGEPRHALLADVNNDGFDDLVVSCNDTRDLRVSLSNGLGAFAPFATLSVGGNVRPDGIAAADLDGNGFKDLVAAVNGQNDTINNVARFMNSGVGFTGPFNSPTLGINPGDVAVADLDCDDNIDVIASNRGSANFSVLHNAGGAIFEPAILYPAGLSPEAIGTGDLDGNGSPDIAVANRDSGTITVTMNMSCKTPEPVFGDLDGDGLVNGADLGILLGAWGPCGGCAGCPADLDGNCTVNGADLGLMLGNWG